MPALLPAHLSGDAGNFRAVNDFARETSWLHGVMVFLATYGVVLLALLLVAGWWTARRRSSPRGVAIAVWGALGALVALAIAQPISHAGAEPRPFLALPHVLTLVHHASDPGFPSDHSVAAGAVAAALWFVSWRLGAVTTVLALAIAFSRVYVGVHFPQDVAAGLALGAATTALGVFVVVPLLARIATALTRTPLQPLVVADRRDVPA